MGLTGPFERLRSTRRAIEALGKPGGPAQRAVLSPVARRVKAQIARQLETGTGPDGAPQEPRKDGAPGLRSRKIPASISVRPEGEGVRGDSSIDWLDTHQRGHVFAARRGGGQTLRYSARGRLVSEAKYLRQIARTRARALAAGALLQGAKLARRLASLSRQAGRAIVARAHFIGPRVLKARPIYPPGGVTEPWARAIGAGAGEGLRTWFERAVR